MSEPLELNLAMVGGSFMAKVHSSAYAMLPAYSDASFRVRRRVLVEATDELAARAAAALGFDEWSSDWREVVKRDDIDAIDIVAPNRLHHEIVLEAAKQRKHVICEKPLARSLSEAREMVEAVAEAGIANVVCFNYRHTPAIALAKRMLDEDRLGELRHFRGFYLQDWALAPDSPFTWRFSREEAGSGAAGDIASHLLDYALHLAGPITRVCALARTFVEQRPAEDGEMRRVDVDDAVLSLLEFSNSAIGSLEATRFATGRKNSLGFELHGGRGGLRFSWDTRDWLHFYDTGDDPGEQGFRAIQCGPDTPLGREFWPIAGIGFGFLEAAIVQAREFVRAVRAEPSAAPTFADGLAVERVLAALETSAEEREWVEVEAT
jgi:predicted dehydrogenase